MRKKLVQDCEGSVAFLFALALFIVLGLSGLAIDQSVGYSTRMSLQAATDAAVLTTTKSLADGDEWNTAETNGQNIFKANMAKVPGSTLTLVNNGTAGNYQVSANAEAPWKRTITFLYDGDDRKIRISASSFRQRTPVEVIFLADVSYSMGIGAARSDVDKMVAGFGCAFACHTDGTDTRARNLGARLRIDVIQDAYREAINEITKNKGAADLISVGLITFSNSVVNSVTPTTDLNAALSNASLIKFPIGDNQAGTDLHAAADAATAMIAQRKLVNRVPATYVVVWLTDGVEDTKMMRLPRSGVRDMTIPITSPYILPETITYLMTFSTDLCNGIKAQGAYVMVLNTVYVTQRWSLAAAGVSQLPSVVLSVMPDRLKQCASQPEYVESANDPASILDAVKTLTRLAISKELRVAN